MSTPGYHNLSELFVQLGLPAGSGDIEQFIASRKLDPTTPLHEAPFWNESQSAFIREAIEQDADWAEVIDDLSMRLRP